MDVALCKQLWIVPRWLSVQQIVNPAKHYHSEVQFAKRLLYRTCRWETRAPPKAALNTSALDVHNTAQTRLYSSLGDELIFVSPKKCCLWQHLTSTQAQMVGRWSHCKWRCANSSQYSRPNVANCCSSKNYRWIYWLSWAHCDAIVCQSHNFTTGDQEGKNTTRFG